MIPITEPPTVAYIPDQIRFELVPGKFIIVDIIDAQLTLERFLKKNSTDPSITDPTVVLLNQIKTWAANKTAMSETTVSQIDISSTVAWSIFNSVQAAYALHKKKLSSSLESAFGLASTPAPSHPVTPKPTKHNWLRSWLTKRSDSAATLQTSQPNGSTT